MQKTLFCYFEFSSTSISKHCEVYISSITLAKCISLFKMRYPTATLYSIKPLVN